MGVMGGIPIPLAHCRRPGYHLEYDVMDSIKGAKLLREIIEEKQEESAGEPSGSVAFGAASEPVANAEHSVAVARVLRWTAVPTSD
jgi:hypothetical protein